MPSTSLAAAPKNDSESPRARSASSSGASEAAQALVEACALSAAARSSRSSLFMSRSSSKHWWRAVAGGECVGGEAVG